jgi:hypothetical protein
MIRGDLYEFPVDLMQGVDTVEHEPGAPDHNIGATGDRAGRDESVTDQASTHRGLVQIRSMEGYVWRVTSVNKQPSSVGAWLD